MSASTSVFKNWVPEWLIRAIIFLVILPSMGLFGLSTANSNAAMGYYGIEPEDVQYSMVIFYAAVASFFALERRFFNFVATRPYLLISTVLQIATSYVCYKTTDLYVLFAFRFLQGMANSSTTSICITLIFGRLHTERSREIGYSVFYGMLLCISSFTTLITAPALNAFDFNMLYKGVIFLYMPGTIMLLLIMKNVRLNRKVPLYQADWASFVIYAVILCLIGYILVYGQQYYWLQDKRIIWSVIAIVVLFALHILRQKTLKRPYLDLNVFSYRNYKIGAILIFVLYICRGDFSITTTYFASVLGLDPIHVAYLLLPNMLAVIASVIIASRLIIMKRPVRYIWMAGFIFLLAFHVWMSFLFSTQANTSEFILPLILQGIGAGLLMTPIIVFMISSVPPHLSLSASATGVFFRFCGFTVSMALVNYFSQSRQSEHYNRFQQAVTDLSPDVVQRINTYKQVLMSKGMAADQAAKATNAILARAVHTQTQMRYAMDYYQFVSWVILVVILIIALYPYINRTIINVRGSQPAPASY